MKTETTERRCDRGQAMTLVELVVTLSILVALTSVAIVSLDGLGDDSRYAETRSRGGMVLEAVNGSSPGVAGAFVADMGRLPAVAATARGAELAELFYSSDVFSAIDASELRRVAWFDNPNTDWGGASSSTFNFSSATRRVELPCGWRGPYVPVHSDTFSDGWGGDWEIKTTDNDTWAGSVSWTGSPALSKTIFGIRSLGKNGQTDGAGAKWENRDMAFEFERGAVSAELTIIIERLDSSASPSAYVPVDSSFMDHVRAAVFAPYVTPDGDSSDNLKRILAVNDVGSASLSVSPSADPGFPHAELSTPALWSGYHSVTLRGLAPGPKKIYVYGFLGTSAANKYGSRLIDVDLKPGANLATVYLVEAL